jgi:hypothetical protein
MMATSSQTTSYRNDPVVMAKLKKHQHMAVANLLTGRLDKLDPTTGDASCQVRALIMLTFHQDLRHEIGDKWDNAIALSKAHLAAHGQDKADTKAKTVADVTGAKHSEEFDALVNRVHDELADDNFELLGLAYSLWAAGILSTDEFSIGFRYRNNNQWGVHNKALQARLATLSCDAFIELAGDLPQTGKWVEALQKTRSVIRNEGTADVPVLSVHATFSVALAILYARSIPIIDGNIRIQLSGDGKTDLTDPSNRSDSPEPSSEVTYTFGTTRARLFVANRKTGTFDLVLHPTEEQKCLPAFFFKTWSTYFEESTDRGFYSINHDQYYDALAKIGIRWAVDVYTSLHPPFSRRAEDANLDITAVYEKMFTPRAKTFVYDRNHLEGSSFREPAETSPNLAERQNLAMRIALQRGLQDECQFVRMGAPSGECTSRTVKAIDWQVVHVFAATLSWVVEQYDALASRHQEAKRAVIGRYVFTLGAVGASDQVEERATVLHNMKKEPMRRARHLECYPYNAPLLKR